eukprot:UN30825
MFLCGLYQNGWLVYEELIRKNFTLVVSYSTSSFQEWALLEFHLNIIVFINLTHQMPLVYRLLVDSESILAPKRWGAGVENLRIIYIINAAVFGGLAFILFGVQPGISSLVIIATGQSLNILLIWFVQEIFRTLHYFSRNVYRDIFNFDRQFMPYVIIITVLLFKIFSDNVLATKYTIWTCTVRVVCFIIVFTFYFRTLGTALWIESLSGSLFMVGVMAAYQEIWKVDVRSAFGSDR